MSDNPYAGELELICIIVNWGLATRIVRFAKQKGILGATICLGKGTVKSRLLEILDLSDTRKEIILMISDRKTACNALEKINSEFNLSKPNHGVAFATSVAGIFGARNYKSSDIQESRGVENTMHKAVWIIVDKGKGGDVMDIANEAGARGGTIINGRGSGIHETNILFSMPIEPEKEIVLILCQDEQADSIIRSIREQFEIDRPGSGIIFVQDVNKTYGLY
ncbi:MAG: P-II family nitrogen regulator [Clostridia bacterium]|nr:P-II family nitrogen regulator [Clostridia bacterium]